MTKKRAIPKALREQVWIRSFGKNFQAKCPVVLIFGYLIKVS